MQTPYIGGSRKLLLMNWSFHIFPVVCTGCVFWIQKSRTCYLIVRWKFHGYKVLGYTISDCVYNRQTSGESASLPQHIASPEDRITSIKHCAPRISSKMATIDECIEFALKNIGLWRRYGTSRHCDEWKYIIIGRIFESEIILIPPSLKISESSSNGSYRNTDEVWWRYGISRSCDEWLCVYSKQLLARYVSFYQMYFFTVTCICIHITFILYSCFIYQESNYICFSSHSKTCLNLE